MTVEPWLIAVVSAASLAAGFVDSIAGGGGLLLVPALLLAGLPPQFALGTTKFASSFGTGAALAVFALHGKVVLAVGVPLALANIAGNQCGSSLALRRGAGLVRGFLLVSLAILLVSLVVKFCL